MESPAARYLDKTVNGCTIDREECAQTVFIGDPTRPAALLGTYVVPSGLHRKNTIAPPCAATVWIEGRPAARVGDKVFCCTSLDTIAAPGEPTVYIGDGDDGGGGEGEMA